MNTHNIGNLIGEHFEFPWVRQRLSLTLAARMGRTTLTRSLTSGLVAPTCTLGDTELTTIRISLTLGGWKKGCEEETSSTSKGKDPGVGTAGRRGGGRGRRGGGVIGQSSCG